ncbi:hypothetical protein GCM10020258_37650 [Sphingomonas yabuuchiae]
MVAQDREDVPPWPRGETGMAVRIRDRAWTETPLGAIGHWPQSLKTVVDLMLASSSMMSLVWGEEAIHLYNDRFTELLREHHVDALGQSAFQTFARSRDVFAADIAAGMAGKSARLQAQRYPVQRNGRLEDAWFDVDYAPVRDEAGRVAGVLWTLRETTAQVLAERTLRESEARHRLLIGSWAQAVWETDPDGVVVTDSPSWRAYTGQTETEWLGYGWLDAIHPDDRAYAERQWREAMTIRGLVDAEFRLRAPDGGWRWTNVRAGPVLDAEGRIEKWAGINIDIDARKRAETALRDSEAKYRALFRSMDEAYAVVEVLRDDHGRWADFRFVEVNPAFLQHTGMPWPVGQTATELLGTPNPHWTKLYGQVLDTGRSIRVEESEPTLDRLFDLNIFPLDTGLHHVAVLFTNITERRRIEERVRASEAWLHLLVEGIPQLVWRSAELGQWSWASSQWQAFTGQSLTASIGRGWLDAVCSDDHDAVLRAWDGASLSGRIDVEFRVRRASDGAYVWHHMRAMPVRDDARRIVEWLGTTTDVQQLKELQERQSILVDELQHRTRNLIGVVRSMADKTARSSADLSDFRLRFRDRLESLARVQGLLSRLHDVDRVMFDDLIRTELSAINGGLDHVSLTGPAGVRLRSSTVQTLAMALHELATNAVKYGALGQATGHLAVTWSLEPMGDDGQPWLHIDWRESGVAMPPAGSAPKGTGQGRELIERALPYQLRARTSYQHGPDGVLCAISLPVSASKEVGAYG